MSDVSNIKLDNTSYSCKDAFAREPTFTEASSRVNISSGDSLTTLFGKIKKYFTDLATVAFSGSYNDLTNQPTIQTITKHTFTQSISINANSTYNLVEHTAHNSNKVIISSISINGSYDVIPITWTYGADDIYINLKNIASITATVTIKCTFEVYT